MKIGDIVKWKGDDQSIGIIISFKEKPGLCGPVVWIYWCDGAFKWSTMNTLKVVIENNFF